MAVKVIIYFHTRDEKAIDAIRKHFDLPAYTTLNGWNPGKIEEKDWPMFKETVKRGFMRFMQKDWTFNGTSYSW